MGLFFEVFGRMIVQRRVQPTHVVVPLNEFLHSLPQNFEVPVSVSVDLFTLERFQKAFARGVVIKDSKVCSYWAASRPITPSVANDTFNDEAKNTEVVPA